MPCAFAVDRCGGLVHEQHACMYVPSSLGMWRYARRGGVRWGAMGSHVVEWLAKHSLGRMCPDHVSTTLAGRAAHRTDPCSHLRVRPYPWWRVRRER